MVGNLCHSFFCYQRSKGGAGRRKEALPDLSPHLHRCIHCSCLALGAGKSRLRRDSPLRDHCAVVPCIFRPGWLSCRALHFSTGVHVTTNLGQPQLAASACVAPPVTRYRVASLDCSIPSAGDGQHVLFIPTTLRQQIPAVVFCSFKIPARTNVNLVASADRNQLIGYTKLSEALIATLHNATP